MSQPEGFVEQNQENKVYKLNKVIYGLKQAARVWHNKITETLKNMDFLQSKIDSCLFTRKRANNTTYIITYVDDILIVGKNEVIEEIIANLKSMN